MPSSDHVVACITVTFLALGTLLLVGCTTFGSLTRTSTATHEGPQASQCGACHVEQYREWQGTAHATAFTSTTFQEAAGSPPEAECLKCHSPLEIRSAQTESRAFHQQEGVTCISCHLSEGKMHGPHASSALFNPHPVKEDRTFYASQSLCATCHAETHTQWQKTAARQETRTCQECHQLVVQRRATQGTNFFSNILVAFEDERPTRSHEITLEKMANFPGGVTITTQIVKTGPNAPALEVTLRNNLPHDLPTGTYGEKEIRLVLSSTTDKELLTDKKVQVSNEQHPIAAGETKKIVFPLPATDVLSGTLRLKLERHSESHAGRPAIPLASTTIDSVSEALH
jgi:nitrate/TMAO reductase-like tetraheme cytochrome c subunit